MESQNLEDKNQWVSPVLGFSFRYGGMLSTDFLTSWMRQAMSYECNHETSMPDGNLESITWIDPDTSLKVTAHLRRYTDFPALDWMLELENGGAVNTPILEEILPLDISLPLPPGERLRLHYANGSDCRKDDFLPQVAELLPHSRKDLAPSGGRSSDTAFPFMNLQRGDGGLVIAIGWSGQWAAHFERASDSLRITSGMERTHLFLRPGEKIRTPRILLISWQGKEMEAGQNLLRRLLLAHYLPRSSGSKPSDGQLIMPPVAQCLQFYFYLTGKAGEVYEMTALPKCTDLGVEVYWIDACWFGGQGQWWQEVGSWEVNAERFPHGLKPISDAARQEGMKFILWFEPERARLESRLAREHPEFFLRCQQDPDNLLLNLGDPVARAYLTDLISRRITEYGVDIYRQDFNFRPLPYWQTADPPDRVGMTEIRHIEGLYAFWDELRARHPKLWIDNCASGGRRIDLETLTRALPLWPSDFTDVIGLPYGLGLHVGDQCINAGLARWVPLFGGGVWNFTPYGTRGQIMGGFTFGCHIDHTDFPEDETSIIVNHNDVMAKGKTLLEGDFPLDRARQAIAEWRSIRPYFLGDFHLLLPLTVSDHDWCAWQLHRGDWNAGVALLFRRHRSPFPAIEISLKGINPQAEYEVSLSPEYTPSPGERLSGRELANLSVSIPQAPGSILLRYQQVS